VRTTDKRTTPAHQCQDGHNTLLQLNQAKKSARAKKKKKKGKKEQ
jgi:hypothetical protein